MKRVNSGYKLPSGTELWFSIIMKDGVENGFDIYMGENSTSPIFHQPEPYIPDKSLTYEENALNMCKTLSEVDPITDSRDLNSPASYEDIIKLRSDIDYLLLLNDLE